MNITYIYIILIILIPFFFALLIVFINNTKKNIILNFLFIPSLITFFLSIKLLSLSNYINNFQYFNFLEIKWLAFLNLNFSIGLDNISLLFILLTTFIFLICSLASWKHIAIDVKLFSINILLLESLLILIFLSCDLFFFYIFFESILIPMFFIIGKFGSRNKKISASFLLFIYTFIGSIFMLIGILFIYYYIGTTNYYILLTEIEICDFLQKILWWLFFIAFAVKVPMIPFHLWLPEAHVEAPTPGSVILAGILLKLGTFGMIRFLFALFPYANYFYSIFVGVLSIIGILYASITAFKQFDFKRVIAYSSISHMNLIVLGLYTHNIATIVGSLVQMFGHGLIAGALFLSLNVLYERFHERTISHYSGIIKIMPIFCYFFLFISLSNISFPGTISFVAEYLMLYGILNSNYIAGLFALISMLLTSTFTLWLFNRISFGNINLNGITSFIKKCLIEIKKKFSIHRTIRYRYLEFLDVIEFTTNLKILSRRNIKHYIKFAKFDFKLRDFCIFLILIIFIIFFGINPTILIKYLYTSVYFLNYNIYIYNY